MIGQPCSAYDAGDDKYVQEARKASWCLSHTSLSFELAPNLKHHVHIQSELHVTVFEQRLHSHSGIIAIMQVS